MLTGPRLVACPARFALDGLGGDDILDGGGGVDTTIGGSGADIHRIGARTNLAGDQAFSWIGSNAFNGTAGQLRAYEQGGTWFGEGDTKGDSVADLVIALTLQGPTPLGAGDFLL